MFDQNTVELRWIIAVFRRWWKLIAGLPLLAAVAALIITSIMPPVYESSTLLLVNPSKYSTANQYNELMAGTQLALTYSQMVKDRPVLETVIAELGLKVSAESLAKRINAEPVHNSQIIKLTVTDTNSEQAALIANTLAQAFTRRVEELSTKRYAGTIQNAKTRIEDLQAQIKETQAEIDSIRSQKVTKDVALANKQTSLTILQSGYQSLQNSYQDMQLTVAEVTGKVYIVEPVQVQKSILQATNSATVVVSVSQSQSTNGNNLSGDRLALTYGQLIIKQPLLLEVINELGLSETTDQLSKKISFELVPGTQLIRFKVEDSEELKAQLIAQSLVDDYIAQVKTMLAEPYSDRMGSMQQQIEDMEGSINSDQAEIGGLTSEITQLAADLSRLENDLTAMRSDYRESLQNYQLIQTTAAEASDAVIVTEPAQSAKHSSQNRMLYVVIAAFLGLAIGVAIALFFRYYDDRILTDQDVRTAVNMPVLSTIGQLAMKNKDLVLNSAPTSIIAEDFRVLANKIHLYSKNNSIKTLLITSPFPSEGKSMIVSNLAIGLSRMGLRIVLIDADLRLPRLRSLFRLASDDGLTTSLRKGHLNGNLQSAGIGDLKILTSGGVPSDPAELLSSPNLALILQDLKENTDLVLIDCPPVLTVSDASILASKVDGVMLVLRAGVSEGGTARDAVEALRQVKANLVGIVLNATPNRRKNSYYSYT